MSTSLNLVFLQAPLYYSVKQSIDEEFRVSYILMWSRMIFNKSVKCIRFSLQYFHPPCSQGFNSLQIIYVCQRTLLEPLLMDYWQIASGPTRLSGTQNPAKVWKSWAYGAHFLFTHSTLLAAHLPTLQHSYYCLSHFIGKTTEAALK